MRKISSTCIAAALMFGGLACGSASAQTYTYSLSSTFYDWVYINGYDPNNLPAAIVTDSSGSTYGLYDGGAVSGTFTLDSQGNWLGGSFTSTATTNTISNEAGTFSGASYTVGPMAQNVQQDLFSIGASDYWFADDLANYVLDINLPDLSSLVNPGDSLSGYTGVVSEYQDNLDGSYGGNPNLLDGYARFDLADDGSNVNAYNMPAFNTDPNTLGTLPSFSEAGPTSITLTAITPADQGGGGGNPAPEPASLALLGSGLIGLGAFSRFRRRK